MYSPLVNVYSSDNFEAMDEYHPKFQNYSLCVNKSDTKPQVESDKCLNVEHSVNGNGETCLKATSSHDSSWNWSEPINKRFCKVDFMNWQYNDIMNNLVVTLVFIHGVNKGNTGGFYFMYHNMTDYSVCFCKCIENPSGYLQVVYTTFIEVDVVNIPMVCDHMLLDSQDQKYSKQVYNNYLKDCQMQAYYKLSYVQYMEQVIDMLITVQNDETVINKHESQSLQEVNLNVSGHSLASGLVVTGCVDTVVPSQSVVSRHRRRDPNVKDYNFASKNRGHLVLQSTQFEFIGPDREVRTIASVDQYLDIARIVLESGQPNYKQARIPIKSGLNLEAWESRLASYPDRRLFQYLKFGFPLSINKGARLGNSSITNHFSARQFPNAIDQYLGKEIELGAIWGPFTPPMDLKIHCSPLMTRPKDLNKRRVILDLSYPQGASVNDYVSKDRFDGYAFMLRFPSMDDIVEEIKKRGRDVSLAKIDVARAFRNLRVDPADALNFGIEWQGSTYLDSAAAFGWTHGSAAYQLLSDAIAFFMAQQGHKMFPYIDDYIIVTSEAQADKAFTYLSQLLEELGLPMNSDKKNPPTKRMSCLGIVIDTSANTLSIDPQKLETIHRECIQVRHKQFLSKRAFQSLLGKLLYIHKCVEPSRMFINRMLALFRENYQVARIPLTEEFHKDLTWFITFLPRFNGITYIKKTKIMNHRSLHVDASLTGLGGIWGTEVYATPVSPIVGQKLKIVHLEMLNIVVALRLWAPEWAHSTVKFFCDNWAVVQVVKTGKTRDAFLGACSRNIWLLAATYDIALQIEHIMGKKNIYADALSRIYSDKPINPQLVQYLRNNFCWRQIPEQFLNLDLHV